jgi:hypothetical protein
MNQEIISRYIGQPASLPGDVRAALERAWDGRPGTALRARDLDHTLKLRESWLALGASHVAVARLASNGSWEIESVERSRIASLRDVPVSARTRCSSWARRRGAAHRRALHAAAARGGREHPLRARRGAHGRSVPLDDADRVYADAVARPVRDAQALVAGRESAVMFRLLRYLAPYRRR